MDVDVDEDTLTKIAQQTDGKYYRADSADTLRQIYAGHRPAGEIGGGSQEIPALR